MAEFFRSAIASPRSRHYDPVADTYLDLAYLDNNIIVCSMPTAEFPKILYRNSLSDLRKLLSLKHGSHWHVWEFRAEGAGYDDSEFFNRVSHFPFPDHNPPPFAMLPSVISSIHKFLSQNPENVAVLHCKAGKGRSGTIFCAYMIAQHRWTAQNALAHFTARRMRSGFGEGVSILSQRRWISYVETWSRDPNREYRELPAVITEVRILNPVKGIEVRICGFKEHGKKIATLYEFGSDDSVQSRELKGVDGNHRGRIWFGGDEVEEDSAAEAKDENQARDSTSSGAESPEHSDIEDQRHDSKPELSEADDSAKRIQKTESGRQPADFITGTEVILRPRADIHVTADVNISVEKKLYGPAGLSFLSSTAYTWFNLFFEGDHDTGGTFSIKWEDMDGFKGTKKRGGKIFDRIEVDWVIWHPMEFMSGDTARRSSVPSSSAESAASEGGISTSDKPDIIPKDN
ncbi:protein-tyrosine phosphatase-like protein [Myxozyma melibiosi]|uniref:phosphatidylinositol-3,4,5-trisphosphate 3-phosphatase n=1 Tax=Myxozyma melibiosi TaxID=54550 RepID=A0ABR1FDX4_9ASCO